MSTEQQIQQGLAELPTWLLILVALAGLVGEMGRADLPGIAMAEIIKRVMLRFGSSALCGMAALLAGMYYWNNVYLAGAVAIGVGLVGADIVVGIYARYIAKRAGVDVPPRAGQPGE
ncbi:phage holin family protein [Pseudomonas mendocina]|uniref:phage holin family protein n=1 Tax=Ectopseudomonas mendocina TaxID=300 RepID=UPI0023DC9300|nr:phage holin family protein [Pseudomonas mendocina]MDF2076623.1 phage holin family protein [Pseudomonas mendocina]